MEGEGFEPSKAEPSDLQSDPFDRSGTPPNETGDYEYIATISQSRFGLILCTAYKKTLFGLDIFITPTSASITVIYNKRIRGSTSVYEISVNTKPII